MNKKIINTCIAATLLGLASLNAQAATIDLVPTSSTNILIGQTISFDLWGDFSDVGGTIGGGLDLFYDNLILAYNGDFAFDLGLGNDATISRTGDDCSLALVSGCASAGEINGISANQFAPAMMSSGATLMGTLSFTAIAEGLTDLTMADNDTPAGGWIDNTGLGAVSTSYNSSRVVSSRVPVPAAAWLMLSGMGLLGGVLRRKANT